MNWRWIFDGIIILTFCMTVYRSYKRGFVDSIAGIVSILTAFIGARSISFVLDGVLERQVFKPMLETLLKSMFTSVIDETTSYVENGLDAAFTALSVKIQSFTDQMARLGIPCGEAAAQDTGIAFDSDSLRAYAEQAAVSIAQPIAQRLSEIFAVLILFTVIYLVMRAVFSILSAVVHIPILNGTNKLLGALCGVLLGLISVFIMAHVVVFICGLLLANDVISEEMIDALNRSLIGHVTKLGAGNQAI